MHQANQNLTTSSTADVADTELLACCTELDTLERQRLDIMANQMPPDSSAAAEEAWQAAYEQVRDRQQQLACRICELEAQTLDGCRAKARPHGIWHGMDPCIHASLMRDLLAA